MKRNILKTLPVLLFAALTLVGCKKYDNPESVFEEYEQEPDTSIRRKVLFVSIDGLVGKELEKEVPTNIGELMKNAKYSFDALTDIRTSDAATWATMLTGYTSDRHHIENENFLPAANPDDPHGEVNFTPSVIYRIEEQQSTLKTSIVVQDDGLANVLLMDADDNVLVKGDDKVKEAAVGMLKGNNVPDLLVVQFKDVLNAGKDHGFLVTKAAYKEAINKVDEYVGDLFKTIKGRDTYEFEDWLIILTSNHGGVDKDYGGESFQERNVFSLYYQKDIKGQELVPEMIVSPQFHGYDGGESGPKEGVRARNSSEASGEDRYNVAKTGKMTIEAKVKVNKNADGTWSYSVPPFLSKVANRSGSTAGWSFFRTGNNVAFFVADGATKVEIVGGPVSIDDQWSHMTGTVEAIGKEVVVKFYVNGTLAAEGKEELNIDNIKSTSPITFGFQPSVFLGGFIDCHLADIHIWDTVLSADEILENSRRIGVPENHAKINNLVGFWPMDDGGQLLKNKVLGMPDIPLQGKYQYKVLGNNLPFVDESAILVQNVDVSKHILYWLGINAQDKWALDGNVFLSKFELEFLK